MMLVLSAILLLAFATDPPTIVVDRDNVEITRSCRVQIAGSPIIDADNNGVIHITASDIAVDFADQSLRGASDGQLPDTFTGTGIVITGRNVTLSGAKVAGYKVGIHASKADGLTVHHCDVSDNFHQHLKSTQRAEDGADWLWPHANDNNEWITNYGAGLCVEDSKNVTLHDIRARRTQNGIILDAVNDSKVYDCDCSFLSGWGLALWRSSRNIVSRNAFDFCVRGYSHGVYNRGQDSAGILMFEQCCDNVIAENSATHCGDGFFGFAGKEALGEVNRHDDVKWYERRGCNGNVFSGNDFSFAAAHGLELTFSFKNRVTGNQFRGNAICGIWGGYSQAMVIDHNRFELNGEGAYGRERGGVNIEHGRYNMIGLNQFTADACGVFLWWDEDKDLLRTPWAQVNDPQSSQNFVLENHFADLAVGVQLQQTTKSNIADNAFQNVAKGIDADAASADFGKEAALDLSSMKMTPVDVQGSMRTVGARGDLDGRQNIIMTEWGPWDHNSALLQFTRRFDGADDYQLLGMPPDTPFAKDLHATGDVLLDITGERICVRPKTANTLTPYQLSYVRTGAAPLTSSGLLTGGYWTVWTFPSSVDPRQDADKWRRDGEAKHHELSCDPLDLAFGNGSMSDARHLPVVLPRDHFGCIATRKLTFPKGKWRIDTTSDDGIRVWLDDQIVIDDWTWHPPTRRAYGFEAPEGGREVSMRVEYFELDGFAVLQLNIAPTQ